jgi:hypothetical protein
MKHDLGLHQGYSIIAAVLMIGFLLIVTTSTLNLVLTEMRDGKGRQDYLKALYWAWAAQEIALLQIKNLGYGYDEDSWFTNTDILGSTLQDAKIIYSIDSKVQEYIWMLEQWETQIIPLFWIDAWSNVLSINDIDLDVNLWDISWNIIWKDSWESWMNNFSSTTSIKTKTFDPTVQEFKINSIWNIWNFLSHNSGSYLVIFNSQLSQAHFTLRSADNFSLPTASIISSGTVWKYTQSLQTQVDNTEFLGILKYSIYSWN